ncbi:MAG TPA: nicotinate phosphoribosyltransferase [Lacipirellulaceae bacterium]|nr:nicotinate phosphoribosyltransferase [Lacipirellulaceae bacterium]
MADNLGDDPQRSALFTDLYELTMAQAYGAEAFAATAVFELFFRKLPATRQYVVAAGLDDVLNYLENFHVTDNDIAYLAKKALFSRNFLQWFRELRFTGDVWAVPEGTPVFPNEPVVQVVAPIAEAQLIETLVLNQIHFQSVVATKAARIVRAAEGRAIVDFGSRRAHSAEAAMKAARVSYLAGAAGTSLVLAGKRYGIPIFGTMAHSYIQAHDDETDAFRAFATIFPHTTLLVDTYDTLDGVRKVIQLSRQMGENFPVSAIRLDSGDLADLANRARSMLDEAGLNKIGIFASSELDEFAIQKLVRADAPIDGFGVGTSMAVSSDAPTLDMAYKLVEYSGKGRTKLSPHKFIYPGRKQVFRETESGQMIRDTIARADETRPGAPQLIRVMRGGRRISENCATLNEARDLARRQLDALPNEYRQLEPGGAAYPVTISDALSDDLETLRGELKHRP